MEWPPIKCHFRPEFRGCLRAALWNTLRVSEGFSICELPPLIGGPSQQVAALAAEVAGAVTAALGSIFVVDSQQISRSVA